MENRIIQDLKKSLSLSHYRERSQGNWKYPFLALEWKIASYFTRSRKVECDGVSFTLPCKNWITHFRWFLFERKEPEVRYYINNYLKSGDVLFDIGANIGVFSIFAGKKGIRVFSFEPEYSNLALLKENVLQNRLTELVSTYSVGISDFVGFSQLHLQSVEDGAAAHTENKGKISKTDEGFNVVYSEGITTATLDHICGLLNVVPHGLKIDTDGNELKILNGARKMLANPKVKSMIIEIPSEPNKRELCIKVLQEFGFKPDWVKPETNNQIWIR